jgi:hypothetical protein
MDLPSGRSAFIERMESLMGQTNEAGLEVNEPIIKPEHNIETVNAIEAAETTETAETTDISSLIENTIESKHENSTLEEEILPIPKQTEPADPGLKSFTNNIRELVEQTIQNSTSPSKSILAVVDSNDEKPIVNSAVEVIDPKTFEIIQRLVKSGILSMNEQIKILSSSNEVKDSLNRIHEEQILKAKNLLAFSARKHKMAKLLIDQEFLDESINPLREALETIIYAFSCLTNANVSLTQNMMTTQYIEENLIQYHGLPDKALIMFTALRTNIIPENIELYLHECEDIYKHVNELSLAHSESFYLADSSKDPLPLKILF